MEPEAKYTLVGTVVLLLVTALVAAVVWLRGTGDRDDIPYKIYFAHHSLEGLQVRSDVKMQGIRIGSVTGFRISLRRPGSVEVFIRVDRFAPVREDTRATVERHLLTGIASIRLTNTGEGGPPLAAADPHEPYPIIPEGETDYRLTETVGQVALRADETMRRINQALSDENQAALSEILENVRRISADLQRTAAGVDRTLVSLAGAAEEVRKASTGISAEARRLGARYDSLGREATVAAQEVAGTMRQIGADMTRLAARVDGLVAEGGLELRATAQELRSTAQSLGAAARRLSDPGRALRGPSAAGMGPGEAAR